MLFDKLPREIFLFIIQLLIDTDEYTPRALAKFSCLSKSLHLGLSKRVDELKYRPVFDILATGPHKIKSLGEKYKSNGFWKVWPRYGFRKWLESWPNYFNIVCQKNTLYVMQKGANIDQDSEGNSEGSQSPERDSFPPEYPSDDDEETLAAYYNGELESNSKRKKHEEIKPKHTHKRTRWRRKRLDEKEQDDDE